MPIFFPTPHNQFCLTSNTCAGIIQIKKQIDYEKVTKLNFTIFSFDSGIPQLNASAIINVNILNINDNDPIFSAKEYNASVSENSPVGTQIVVVSAIDADSGDFGKVTYSLTGEHSDRFKINPDNGEITIGDSQFLDHEVLNETVLQVVASDGAPGNLKRSVTVPVYVAISDVNDNAPVFAQEVYNVTVSENVRLNPPMPLLQVNATDADEGTFGNVRYTIIEGNHNGKGQVFKIMLVGIGLICPSLYYHIRICILLSRFHDFKFLCV